MNGWMMHEMMRRPRPGKMFVAFTAGLLFLMLAIFVGVQIWGNPWFKNIKAEITAQPYARTITVDGEGKVAAKPDIAKISFSVVAAGKTVKAVTDDSNKKMNAIVDQLKGLGIKAEDIQTSEYNLYPEYNYPTVTSSSSSKAPSIVGYNLSQTVNVKIRDLTKSDDALDKAISAGANQVGSLTFDIDDASQVKNQAREKAFQAARTKAEQMANAAGVKLGRVVTFSESTSAMPMPYANFAMKAESANVAAPSLEPGSKEMNISVSVTYEIE
jgi:hypothetical protein